MLSRLSAATSVGRSVGRKVRSPIHRLSARATQTQREPGYYADGAGLYLQVKVAAAEAQVTRSWLFRYKRSDGRVFGLEICLIDSGSGGHYDTVYEFCGRWANTHPSKGFQDITRLDRKNLGDVLTKDNFKRYKASKRPEGVVLYEISTNFYKRQLYKRLKLERIPGAIQKTGFCDFPIDYDMNYFKQLTAAELRSDGSFYDESRAHEALDCRVGNMCAGDVFLDAMVDDLKKRYRDNGMDRYQVQEIDKNFVLEYLKTETIRIDKPRQ